MTVELIANSPIPGTVAPITTLATGVVTTPAAGTQETWTLAASPPAALCVAGGQFRFICEQEILLDITGASGSSRTVLRGQEGSTVSTHPAGAQVFHDLTAGALTAIVRASAATIPSIEAYGHSWIADYGATNARYGFVERLANMLGKATVNKVALTGGYVAGVAASGAVGSLLQNGLATDLTAGPYITRGGLKLCAIGFNDAALYAGITNGDKLVESALTAAFSRLLAARVIPALVAGPALNSAELTYTGAWTASADATASIAPGVAFTATNGNSVTLNTDAAYAGEPITILLPLLAGASTVTVTVDGGASVASLNTQTLYNVLIAAGVAGAVVAIRLPAGTVSAGTHAVKATMTSINSLQCVGGFLIESNAPPPLIVPGFPLHEGDSIVGAQAPWSNTRNQNVIAGFPSALYVDLNPAMSPNYPSAVDLQYWNASLSGHPNNLGYGRIAALLQPVIRGLLTPSVAAAMN